MGESTITVLGRAMTLKHSGKIWDETVDRNKEQYENFCTMREYDLQRDR